MSKTQTAKATGRWIDTDQLWYEVVCPECKQAQYVVPGRSDCIQCGFGFTYSKLAKVPDVQEE